MHHSAGLVGTCPGITRVFLQSLVASHAVLPCHLVPRRRLQPDRDGLIRGTAMAAETARQPRQRLLAAACLPASAAAAR